MSWLLGHIWTLGAGLGLGGLGVLAAVFPQISLPILTAIGEWFARRSLSEIALFIVAALLVWQHLSLLDAHRQIVADAKQINVERAAAKIIAQKAVAMKAQIDAQSATISQTNKDLHDAQNARIDADAAAARVRGPGKAACPGHTIPSAPASGREQTPAAASPAGPTVPAINWIAVPFDWLVTVLTEHDQLLNDEVTYRNNDQQQRKAWPKQ